MGVPTHGPGCQTVFSRPVRCQTCDRFVYYWGCTCGSRVIFDPVGESWSKHQCTDASSTKPRSTKSGKKKVSSGKGETPDVTFINTYTYGVLSVVCPRCGKSVRKKELDAHNYYTHGIVKKPSKPVKAGSVPEHSGKSSVSPMSQAKGKESSKRPMVTCKVCKQSIRQSRLEKHMRKAHDADLLSASTPKVTHKVSPVGCRLPNGTVSTKPVTECEICSMPVRLDRLEEHIRRVHPAQAGQNNTGRGRR